MDKQEKIVCAAMQFEVIDQEDISYEITGVDYECIRNTAFYDYIYQFEDLNEKEGFITSKNRFVDAKEAMRIAVEENQIEAIRKAFDAIPNFHDKGIDSHEFGEAANAAIDIRDEYLARELKPEDLY